MSPLDFISPLFVPGNRPERFEKAARSGADAVIIDLEDAVGASAKSLARSCLRADFSSVPLLVRINGRGTQWHVEDLAAVARLPLATVMLPKAELGPGLHNVCTMLGPRRSVIALIETACGLAQARQIASVNCVARLAFGSIDYAADLGCAHEPDALLAATSELVLASSLADLPAPLDGVTTTFEDPRATERDACHARDLGFGGKLCIHPRQASIVRDCFRPSDTQVAWAQRVLGSGDDATALDGVMVDEPVRARARRMIATARALKAGSAD